MMLTKKETNKRWCSYTKKPCRNDCVDLALAHNSYSGWTQRNTYCNTCGSEVSFKSERYGFLYLMERHFHYCDTCKKDVFSGDTRIEFLYRCNR